MTCFPFYSNIWELSLFFQFEKGGQSYATNSALR
jgi:hypothetical protein